MTVAAWKIVAWPRVSTPLVNWQHTLKRLRPLGTTVLCGSHPNRLREGQQVWGASIEGSMIGIAWDWREVMPSVLVMSDPMSIVTNATLVDEEGTPVDQAVHLMEMNAAIYQLPWQARAMACAAQVVQRVAA